MSAPTARVPDCPNAAPVPRGDKRRREIADVAERVFFENGFTDTTMQTIAEAAGASKETLYRHFGSKEGLFAEIVERRARSFLAGLEQHVHKPGSVADGLREVATAMMDAMVGPDGIVLCRTVVSEVPRNPELGRIFYANGPERVRLRLADFLASATARGELVCPDPARAARFFLGLVLSFNHLTRLVLPEPPPVAREALRADVEEAVALFMRCYGAPPRPAEAPFPTPDDGV